MAVRAKWAEYTGITAWATPTAEGDAASGDPTPLTNTNWVSTDAVNSSTASFPITNNTFSFFKRQSVRFTGFAAESVDDFRLYATSGLSAAGQVTGTATDTLKFHDVGNKNLPAAGPNASALGAPGPSDMPASLPGAANVVGGPATANDQGTNFFEHQIFVHTSSAVGKTVVLALRYSVVG